MHRMFSLIVIVCVLLATAVHPLAAAEQPSRAISAPPAITDQYIVAIKQGRDARAVARAAGVTPKHVFNRVLNGFVGTLNAGQRTALQRHPDVALVEPDQVVQATGTQTIDLTNNPGLWGLDRIDQRMLPLDEQYLYTGTGAGVTAYLIDSGIQADHPDFGSRAQQVYDAYGESGVDCHGHGTHLAGIIGGTTHGVAKQINLRGVRVLQCDAQGLMSDAIRGIDWVATNAIKPAVATIAFSPANLSSSNSGTLHLAVNNLINAGVFVAVAAGNNNVDACNVAPANISAAFTVAASTRTDQRYAASNFGACVDGYAPGAGITSAWINGTTNTLSGTSQATAFVAGAAALYKASNGEAAQATINDWLTSNAMSNLIQGNPVGTPNRLLYLSSRIHGFNSVSAGYLHTCGLHTNNTIVCWGDNDNGRSTPPNALFLQVSAGYASTCGILMDRTITCWGYMDGQQITPSGTFTQVSVGRSHSCGLDINGTIICWGNNEFGQSTSPGGQFLQLGLGRFHTCGLRTNRSIDCWGIDSYGLTMPPSGEFTQLSVGRFHACGLRMNQSIACWGDRSDGQTNAPSDEFASVSAGVLHSCGVRVDKSIACWGNNEFGQSTPPGGQFLQVTVGYYHTCGLTITNAIICWGSNSHGQTSTASGTNIAALTTSRAGSTSACPGACSPAVPGSVRAHPTMASPSLAFVELRLNRSTDQARFGSIKSRHAGNTLY